MDPSNIVSIIELSTSALKLGSKVYDEFSGHDPSVKKLQRLNVRLQGLHELLQKIAKSGIALLNAQYLGTATTLRECKAFLNDYDATLSSKSGIRVAVQRTGFLFSESRLEGFNKRIDDHFQELSTYMNVELMWEHQLAQSTTADLGRSVATVFRHLKSGTAGSATSGGHRSSEFSIIQSGVQQYIVVLVAEISHGINGSTSYPASIAEDEEDVPEDPVVLPEGRPRRDDQPVGHHGFNPPLRRSQWFKTGSKAGR
ncbi:uncharacterized protein PG986_013851 [Apiospora aurea]|uniref:Fungal N-terminal domain-containing protein n=1 Tax=Apiospora aurea TaxID=335848 RepID=A0ABR1PX16_9PEZI